MEILAGSVDEIFLIGDRTARVASESLTDQGKWEEVLTEEEEKAEVLGKDICLPVEGNFFFRNAVNGVTDRKLGGKRYVEGSQQAWVIPE